MFRDRNLTPMTHTIHRSGDLIKLLGIAWDSDHARGIGPCKKSIQKASYPF